MATLKCPGCGDDLEEFEGCERCYNQEDETGEFED